MDTDDDAYKETLAEILDNTESLNHKKKPGTKASVPIVILCSFTVILLIFLSFTVYRNSTKNNTQTISDKGKRYIEKNIVFFDFMYQHRILFSDYCKQNGYELKNYPVVFDRLFSAEIAENKYMFKMFSEFFPDLKEKLTEETKSRLTKETEKELNVIRRALIISQLAKANHTVPKKIEWNERYYEAFPVKLVCKYLDNNSEHVLKNTYEITKKITK